MVPGEKCLIHSGFNYSYVPAPAEGHLNTNSELWAARRHPCPSPGQAKQPRVQWSNSPQGSMSCTGALPLAERTDFVLNAGTCGHPTVCPLTHLPPGMAFLTHPTESLAPVPDART